MAFAVDNLKHYDVKNRTWVLEQITNSIKGLGSVMRIVARVDDLNALNAVESPRVGDLYLVGAAGAPEFAEYVRTSSDTWEYMGVTGANIDGYIDEYNLYKGGTSSEPGIGTPDEPAEGTVLSDFKKVIKEANDALEAKFKETVYQGKGQDAAPGTGTEDEPAEGTILARLKALEAPIDNSTIDTMFDENTPTVIEAAKKATEGSP